MSRVQYFNLAIRAPARLAMMRADFAEHPKKYPYCPESLKPKTLFDIRGWGFHNWQSAYATLGGGFEGRDKAPIWSTHTGPYFNREEFADEMSGGPDHQGWYTDTDGRETARGIVVRLSHERFLAGYHWSNNDERVYFASVYDDERQALRAADSHAETFAESAREDSERFDAMQSAEDDCADKLKELQRAFALRHHRCGSIDEAREALQALRDARAAFERARKAYERGE